jgi:predicted nucleic acid-binding protein
MPAFLDTSALIKQFVEETGTQEIRRLIESDIPLLVSELTTVEGVSALAKKVRKTEISISEFRSLLRALMLFLVSGRCEVLPLGDTEKKRARTILSTWALSHSLGSLDALQLAAAVRAGEGIGHMDFFAADLRLLAAAQAQGFTVKNPGVA